ncbi:MAG TPA: hypothetical protein VI072_03160 [Polyangiaceae bacterium]
MRAQAERPERDSGWKTATTITALSAGGVALLMPRVFYSDPGVTVGWKARYHVSVLAPVMTITALSLANEVFFQDWIEGNRPDCNDDTLGDPRCASYGMMSTHSFFAFSAFGEGTGVFLADTFKWSDGRFNGGAFVGHVGVPLVLSVITAVGRTAGNWETGGQVWGSAGIGLATGIGTGLLYALMQRPECGYTGKLICW